jgi:hypothetical protein
MPQQRENSICIKTLLSPPGWDAENNQTFLLVLSRDQAGSPLQTACTGQPKGDTALCQQKRPARFTNGLEAPDRYRLEMPRGILRMPSRASFHTSSWPKRSDGRG